MAVTAFHSNLVAKQFMGHDVSVIGNHKLRIENLEVLAADLAERFNGLILYGHLNDWIAEDGKMGDWNFVEEGRVGAQTGRVYDLRDFYYRERLEKPDVQHPLNFYLCEHVVVEEYSCMVYTDSFLLDAHFDSRWWNFCRYFTGESCGKGWDEYMQSYRDICQRETARVGGNAVLYLDDQGKFKIDEQSFETILFEDGIAEIETLTELVNVSEWVRNGRKPLKEYPRAFYDDFTARI